MQALAQRRWVDNHGSLFLKSIGCQSIVYFTRPGKASSFAEGAAKQMGADDEFIDAFFNLDNPNSSFSKSLDAVDVSVCIDWDQFGDKANPADLGFYGYAKAHRMHPLDCKSTLPASVDTPSVPIRCQP